MHSVTFSALKNNDRVGLGLFTDSLEKFVSAKKGKKHMMEILKKLLSFSNVIISSHQAFLTKEALETIFEVTALNLNSYRAQKYPLPNQLPYN